MEIRVIKSTTIGQKPRPKDSDLVFGKYTTDHMFLMDYHEGKGWHDARIEPYQELRLDPTALVLHYSQEVFEGLKAYNLEGGGIGLFRPDKNIERMNASAQRMDMQEIDPALFLKALKELVLLDRDWIPNSEGTSLYIRPTMIANEPALGVKSSEQFLFFIVMCSVGAYYTGIYNPIKIYVTDEYVRVARGGAGEAKTAVNYGATLIASRQAAKKGCSQVLWLDAKEQKYVEEVSSSNIFFICDDELITPPLGGTILPGITRDSVIQLARHWGFNVSERPISIDEVIDGCKSGSLKEMFATGTAAVVSPVGEISYKGEDYSVGNGSTGKLSERLYKEIMGIQYGRKEDPFGWLVRIA